MEEYNLDAERNHSWVVDVNEKLSEMSMVGTEPVMNRKKAIYRGPVEEVKFIYTPRIVSFGPYYHGHESCIKTEQIKKSVLVRFLSKRSGKHVEDYIEVVSKVVQDLKDAYGRDMDSRWQQDNNAFLQLMIFDGSFLLEILQHAERLDGQNYLDHLEIFDIDWIGPNELIEYYRHDILLIGNQLPMQLLVKLVAVQKDLTDKAAEEYLYKLILSFIAPSSLKQQNPEGMYLHVLDLYRHSLLYQEYGDGSTHGIAAQYQDSILGSMSIAGQYQHLFLDSFPRAKTYLLFCGYIICTPLMILYSLIFLLVILPAVVTVRIMSFTFHLLLNLFATNRPAKDIELIIPSATEMDKVGIGITRSPTKSLKDISFGSRTLNLPPIFIDAATPTKLVNIIAFEQLHADAGNEVTSYIYFMSRLLQVADDVRLLQLRGIIHTTAYSDEVIALFKCLTKDIDPNNFFGQNYRDVGKELTKSFYVMMNNAWQRSLWGAYLKSPWLSISATVGAIVSIFTGFQFVYTMLDYYN